MHITSLPAGGAAGASEVSTVTLYTKQSSARHRSPNEPFVVVLKKLFFFFFFISPFGLLDL